jgi:hypothetical protein
MVAIDRGVAELVCPCSAMRDTHKGICSQGTHLDGWIEHSRHRIRRWRGELRGEGVNSNGTDADSKLRNQLHKDVNLIFHHAVLIF